MHYKFRLVLQLRDKLNTLEGNHAQLLADDSFFAVEAERYNRMLNQASRKWGGAEQKMNSFDDIWEDAPRLSGSMSTPNSGGNSQRLQQGSSSTSSIRQWLQQRQQQDSEDRRPPASCSQRQSSEGRSISSNSGGRVEHTIISHRTTPSNNRSGNATNGAVRRATQRRRDMYDDDNGSVYPDAFGTSDLWERQGSSGI
jgi:hypothetical protein